MDKPKIGIFTTLYNYDAAYSIVSVVNDQLIAHLKHGYTPVLFVLESFKDDEKVPHGTEIRKIVPQIILEPYAGLSVPETYKDDVARIVAAVEKHATDIDFMITHDIVFIDTYLPYNIALRESKIKAEYLHWIHSAPSRRPSIEGNPHANRYTLPPKSRLVYLNNEKALDLAEMYGAWLKDVRVVYNARDPRSFWKLDPFVSHIVDKYDILNADIVSVYPLSTTRMVDGKQIDVVIRIHEALKKLGLKTKLIVPNAHANGENEKQQCRERASADVIFTSLEHESFEMGVPHSMVSDFFKLSNVFIFPTISENCPLVMLEAMLAGNLLVLNKDCTGLEELAGPENALFFKFGNLDMGTRNVEHAIETDKYVLDIAKIIASEMSRCRPLLAKRRVHKVFNYDRMFATIEKLYYEYKS